MPIFYRGAGVDTYWHQNDARLRGFTPQSPGIPADADRAMLHIASGTTTSPFISLTLSYGVAEDYAVSWSRRTPTPGNPAYVYEVQIDDPAPANVQLLDPVLVIAKSVPPPLSAVPYQHNGSPSVLLGLIDRRMRRHLSAAAPQPPGFMGIATAPNITPQLKALVCALRDAEVLAVGAIPINCIRARHAVC